MAGPLSEVLTREFAASFEIGNAAVVYYASQRNICVGNDDQALYRFNPISCPRRSV
jgi:hypothetical protein